MGYKSLQFLKSWIIHRFTRLSLLWRDGTKKIYWGVAGWSQRAQKRLLKVIIGFFLGQKTWKLVGQFHFEVQWIRKWILIQPILFKRLMSFHIVSASLDQLLESFTNSLSFPWCVHNLTFKSVFTWVLSRPTSFRLAPHILHTIIPQKYFRNYFAQFIHVLMIYQHSIFLIHFTSSEWICWRNENFFSASIWPLIDKIKDEAKLFPLRNIDVFWI